MQEIDNTTVFFALCAFVGVVILLIIFKPFKND